MTLHYVPNTFSTYVPKTKTNQPNYPNLNHIQAHNFSFFFFKETKLLVGGFGSLIVVGDQYNRDESPSNFSFNLLKMFCQS